MPRHSSTPARFHRVVQFALRSTVVVLAVCKPLESVHAGKLSRARAAVREDDSSEDKKQPEKRETPAQPRSTQPQRTNSQRTNSQRTNSQRTKPRLATVRSEVRHDHPPRNASHVPPRRPRSHGHRRPQRGSWFSYSQTVVQPTPVCPPAPVYVSPVYAGPVCDPVVVYEPSVVVEPVCVSPPVVETVTDYSYPTSGSNTEVAASDRLAYQLDVSLFAPFPYADGVDGYLVPQSQCPGGKSWSARAALEFGSDFDGLDRRSGSFLLEGFSGWGIDFDWDSYAEDIGQGMQDELHIGDLNLLYRIADGEHALWRVGVGTNWLGDREATDFGLNLSLKLDLFPCDPLVISGEVDWGTLGDAEMFHVSGSVGLMIHRVEIFGGYDHRSIGPVDLQGPMMGIRMWF